MITRQADREVEEPAQAAGDPFDGIQVRPVREDVERHHVPLDAFGAGPHERDPIHALLDRERLADELHEVVVTEVDVRQGELRCLLAIYIVSREGKGEGRTVDSGIGSRAVTTCRRRTRSESRASARWGKRSSGA